MDDNLPPEPICAGLTRQLLNAGKPGQIVVYTFTDSVKETVDAWMVNLHETFKALPPDQPFLALYDLSGVEGSVRDYEYSFRQMREFRATYPDVAVCIACILASSILGELAAQALQLFAHAIGRDHVRVEIFFTRADGLHWLEQFLNPGSKLPDKP